MLKMGRPGRAAAMLMMLTTTAVSPVAAAHEAAAPKPAKGSAAEAGTGAIAIPAFTYPPSSLISEELKRAYARTVAGPGDTISIPTDPKTAATMRTVVNAMFEKSLPFVRERYPVETSQETIAAVEVIRVRPKGGLSSKNGNASC